MMYPVSGAVRVYTKDGMAAEIPFDTIISHPRRLYPGEDVSLAIQENNARKV